MLTQEEIDRRNEKILAGWEHIWAQNTAVNYTKKTEKKLFGADSQLNNLWRKHAGRPALVTGSGPSLEVSLEKLGGRFPGVVICTNSNLSACLRWGLRPDYVHIFDGKYKPDRLEGVPIEGLEMIGCTSLHPEILEWWAGQGRVWLFNMFDPQSFFFQKIIWYYFQCDALPTSGSVAPNALRLAAYLGCNPIIFAGLDLGFTYGKYRVGQYRFENGRWEPKKDKVDISINKQPLAFEAGCPTWKQTGILYKTAAVKIVKALHDDGMYFIRLQATGIRSKYRLEPVHMDEVKDVKVYNATEGGIWADEIERIDLADFAKRGTG